MNADMLLVEKGCPECAVILSELSMDVVTDDEFRGNDGQKFFVFSALSNEASIELLDRFGLAGSEIPVLRTHKGDIKTDLNKILGYLRVNKMSSIA